MATTSSTASGRFRQCVHCGRMTPVNLIECPHCKQELPPPPVIRKSSYADGGILRRGLLYMTLAGVVHYFAGGYSTVELPVNIPEYVPQYLTPAIFLLGLTFALVGVVNRLRH